MTFDKCAIIGYDLKEGELNPLTSTTLEYETEFVGKVKITIPAYTELLQGNFDTDNDFYDFTYDKNWWTYEYKIYLSFDLNNFYASVQSVTGGFRGGGIIDFGGTKKVRQKLIASLTNSVDEQ